MAAKNALKVHKNGVKRTKNALKVHETKNQPKADREWLREVAYQLLEKLESTIKQRRPRTVKQTHSSRDSTTPGPAEDKKEVLFGRKSCVEVLVSLTDLLLKLDHEHHQENAALQSTEEALSMNEADIALVDNFVSRMRGKEKQS